MSTRRLASLLCAVVLLLALATPAGLSAKPTGVYVAPELQAALAAAGTTGLVAAIVNYDPAVTTGSRLASAIQALGAGTITYRHLDSLAARGTAAQITGIAGLTGVTGLYTNSRLTYYLSESVPAIGADRVWNVLGFTGQGIGVAVIDTGIDATHPDLQFGSKTVQNVKIVGAPDDTYSYTGKSGAALYVENVPNTDTSSGHGTHVAGIVAGSGAAQNGVYTGVAKGAHLVGLGAGDTLVVSFALASFDYVLENATRYNIKVINNSWGEAKKAADYDPSHPINRASKRATDRGITVVFAAGNDGHDALDRPQDDAMNTYAAAPWVIAVAAGCKPQEQFRTDLCNGGELAYFSSRGVPGDPQFHPTLTAPGVNIVSARALTGAVNVTNLPFDVFLCNVQNPTYYTCASGTSMAAPHVAGTVALMYQAAGGRLKPKDAKDALVRTTRPMDCGGRPCGLWEAGAGYLDAYAAVLAVQSQPAPAVAAR